MVVQWLGLCTPTARGKGLIPGWYIIGITDLRVKVTL